MRLAFSSPVPPERHRPPLRQRAASFVLAAAITCLIILGLLTLNGTIEERPQFKGGPVLLDLKPDAEQADSTERKSQPKPKQEPRGDGLPLRSRPLCVVGSWIAIPVDERTAGDSDRPLVVSPPARFD